ncbi:MAG: EAL domain-containing protein [Gammaproteobacteria bacterium]|nr:EAL domain-containing protein [Gammaproteobacteria bacterium]
MQTRTFTGSHTQAGWDPHLLLAAMRPKTIKCIRPAARNLGYTVTLAEDLEHFRTHLAESDPDLVVLDLNIPDSFGVAAIRQRQSAGAETGREARIVELLIDLSRRLNFRVCAEGVEPRSNVEMLRAMGSDTAQGFYFGEPASIGQITPRILPASRGGSKVNLGFQQ